MRPDLFSEGNAVARVACVAGERIIMQPLVDECSCHIATLADYREIVLPAPYYVHDAHRTH